MNAGNFSFENTTVNKEQNSFCITCGFDFGFTVNGIDNRVAGIILVVLFFAVLCSPFIFMSIMYCCCNKSNNYQRKNASSTDRPKYDTIHDDQE